MGGQVRLHPHQKPATDRAIDGDGLAVDLVCSEAFHVSRVADNRDDRNSPAHPA